MLYRWGFLAVAALTAVFAGCDSRHSAAAFHLPAGDLDRGKVAFVNLGCSSCHEVPGADLPAPSGPGVVPVRLGGVIDRRLSDGYVVASLLDPSYQLAPDNGNRIASGGKSPMPCYADKMTAQQMVDVVAFLQSRYMLRRWSPQYF